MSLLFDDASQNCFDGKSFEFFQTKYGIKIRILKAAGVMIQIGCSEIVSSYINVSEDFR